ncbi:unnamed protein product, partial [Laminaria digitata]
NPKHILPWTRVAEFPDEGLTVSAGRLFCLPCGTRLGTRKATITGHI